MLPDVADGSAAPAPDDEALTPAAPSFAAGDVEAVAAAVAEGSGGDIIVALADLPADAPAADIDAAAGAAIARLYGEPLLHADRFVYSAGRAGDFPRRVRRAARSAAVPDPPAEFQHPRHPDGAAHAAIYEVCRPDPPGQPGAGRRIPADGGDAHRDQIAHAAAAAPRGPRSGSRRSARGAGAPPARI